MKITYEPTTITASRSEGYEEVSGALIRWPGGEGSAIPREGDSIDCWANGDLVAGPPDGVDDIEWEWAIEEAVTKARRGLSGSIEVERAED